MSEFDSLDLYTKTFLIISGMLLITTITSRINKIYETTLEAVITFLGSFIFLICLMVLNYANYDKNVLFVVLLFFSAFIGWSLGPTMTALSDKFMFNRYLKKIGLKSKFKYGLTERIKKGGGFNKDVAEKKVYFLNSNPNEVFEKNSEKFLELRHQFESNTSDLDKEEYKKEWRDKVFQALFLTFLIMFFSIVLNHLIEYDFGPWGIYLLSSLSTLIVSELLNLFYFKSKYNRTLNYISALIFSLYLIFDFNRLEKAYIAGDNTWNTAIDLSVSIYLDLINLFLDLLQILAESN
ncbi:MAG: Bax inhibitor-1 family protein [Flavobacteriaceae bacterium]|nr:Bax inhibitor-1 family protein [Flavobacteriaceae bacterium]